METENKQNKIPEGFYSFSELNKMRTESASIVEKIRKEIFLQNIHSGKSCLNSNLRTS